MDWPLRLLRFTPGAKGSSSGFNACATLARMTPHAGQDAGSDWSFGSGAWPHFGQRVNMGKR
jgi:hypothetical protein